MKNTILSEKDIKLIEQAISSHGRILDIKKLLTIFKEEYTTASAYKRIGLLSDAGWLKRIKNGLYLIIDSLTARSQIDVSLLTIANVLIKESYVSLSHALNYYNMFDQYANVIVSVTDKVNKQYKVDNFTFTFSKVKKEMFFGFSKKIENGKIVNIADVEKALIDYLYLDKSFGSASLVFEKLRDYHQELDLKKIQEYALRSNITIQREIGFMFDELKMDSSLLYKAITDNRGSSHFTKDSKLFNAKWRLYYDNRIIG
jgi:predicted transcriptional regulator of viral defense system